MTTALITGASEGIGYAFAKLFAAKSYDLILVARGKERLKAVQYELEEDHKVKVHIVPLDLSQAQSAQRLFDKVKSQSIQVLINNAGFGIVGDFEQSNWEEQQKMVHLNITSLIQLCHLYVPIFKKQKAGHILNVSSVAGYAPGPYMATYFASKAYVTSFSIALAEELKETPLRVSVLCPGSTRSKFNKTAGFKKTINPQAMSAQEVAQQGYKALMKGDLVCVPGSSNKKFVFLNSLFSAQKMAKSVGRHMLASIKQS